MQKCVNYKEILRFFLIVQEEQEIPQNTNKVTGSGEIRLIAKCQPLNHFGSGRHFEVIRTPEKLSYHALLSGLSKLATAVIWHMRHRA